eukprot:6217580-Pyramimonas_sp.AAC.1
MGERERERERKNKQKKREREREKEKEKETYRQPIPCLKMLRLPGGPRRHTTASAAGSEAERTPA